MSIIQHVINIVAKVRWLNLQVQIPHIVRRARAVSPESTVLGHVTASARFADASAHPHPLPLLPLESPSCYTSMPDADAAQTPTLTGQRHKSVPLNTCHPTSRASRATPCSEPTKLHNLPRWTSRTLTLTINSATATMKTQKFPTMYTQIFPSEKMALMPHSLTRTRNAVSCAGIAPWFPIAHECLLVTIYAYPSRNKMMGCHRR